MLVAIDRDTVEEMDKKIGKTNVRRNMWRSLLNDCKKFEDAGLTPQIVFYRRNGMYFVTSVEMFTDKMNS